MFFDYLLMYNRYCNLFGIGVILAIAYCFSLHRSRINYRLVLNGLIMQFIIGYAVLKTWIGQKIIETIADGVTALYKFADAGSGFVFGSLIDKTGPWGFIFAFKVLPIIIFFGAFMSILFYFGIIQIIVSAISWVVRPLLGTSGVETLCAISNSFLGQTEAPLLIRNYLKDITKSELLVIMVSGMATISGAILVVFAEMGVPTIHLLTSSMMSIPGALVIAKILCPETEQPKTVGGAEVSAVNDTSNIFDAIAKGTTDGLYLALNVGAMLVSFLALLALVNALLSGFSLAINALLAAHFNFQLPVLTLNSIFAYLFAPFGYLLGFTGIEALAAGQLIGTKVAVNELIAYGEMVKMNLSPRAVDILTYALCGFSNFSCIGIQIGGIGALVPEKRLWLTQFGLYAVLGGTLSNLLSAMVASLLL